MKRKTKGKIYNTKYNQGQMYQYVYVTNSNESINTFLSRQTPINLSKQSALRLYNLMFMSFSDWFPAILASVYYALNYIRPQCTEICANDKSVGPYQR